MAPWSVVRVEVIGPARLGVEFHDGTAGQVLVEHSFMRGVFAPLRKQDFFGRVSIDNGAVSWPGELDLAPDAMHRAIQERGEWVVA